MITLKQYLNLRIKISRYYTRINCQPAASFGSDIVHTRGSVVSKHTLSVHRIFIIKETTKIYKIPNTYNFFRDC